MYDLGSPHTGFSRAFLPATAPVPGLITLIARFSFDFPIRGSGLGLWLTGVLCTTQEVLTPSATSLLTLKIRIMNLPHFEILRNPLNEGDSK